MFFTTKVWNWARNYRKTKAIKRWLRRSFEIDPEVKKLRVRNIMDQVLSLKPEWENKHGRPTGIWGFCKRLKNQIIGPRNGQTETAKQNNDTGSDH